MPLHPGPWLTSPGPLTIDYAHTAPGTPNINYKVDVNATPFATLCEPAAVSGGYGAGNQLRIEHDAGGPDLFTLYQQKITFQIGDDLFLLPIAWSPPLPWPSAAQDWEWEDVTPQLWITSIDVSVTVNDEGFSSPEDVTLLLQAADPATVVLFPLGDPLQGRPEDRPLPGTDLDTTNSIAMLTADTTVTITANFDSALIKNIDDPTANFTPLTLILSFDNMRTHTPPAAGSGRRLLVGSVLCAVNFTPPRWRFLYSVVPRLRQFPRDDFLGGSPRQGKANGSTSIQSSTRQGWKNTYR
jgi:hypothetical protein